MKSIKILTAIVLAFVLALTSVSAEADYPGADKLKEFGFIQGYNGDLMVNKPLTRAEACVLLAELYGEKDKASKFTGKPAFSDIAEKDWYAPYVGYAKERGWFDGYPDGSFKPNDDITVQAWAKLMLTVLDRFENWENSVSDLKKAGVRIYAVDSNRMKRGEAFDAMWAVVNLPAKGDTISIGIRLGKLQSKDAEILSVDTPSLKMLEIKVSEKLNKTSAETTENYKFIDADEKEISIKSATYHAEEDKIVIVFEELLKENADLILSEIGVLTEQDGTLNIGEFGVHRVKDASAPKIVEIKSLGTKALKIYFSEPIMGKEGELSKTNDFIFDKQLSVKRIFLTDEDMSAVVEFHTPSNGILSVYPQKSIRDYSGLSLMDDVKKYTVDMKADTTIPYIESVVKSSPIELVVKLNKNMILSGRGSDGFIVGNRKADSPVELKGDLLRLTFHTNYLPVGKSELVIRRGMLNDYSGVNNIEMKKEIDVPADREIPYSEGVLVEKQNQIRIRYNEPLKKNGSKLLSKTNYKLYKDGEEVSGLISNVNYDPTAFSVILNMNRDLLGDYRLEVQELLDLSGNDGASYYDFEVGDVTAPNPAKWNARLYNPGAADQLIVIRFDEAMNIEGAESVLNPLNYMYGNIAFDKFNQEKLVINLSSSAKGDVVEIRYPGQRHGGTDFEANGTKKLSIARVSDLAGNKVGGFVNTLNIEKSSTMTIEKAYLTDADMIEFEVRDEIYDFDEGDVIFEAGGKILKGRYEDVNANEGVTKFRFRLDAVPTHSITVKTKAGGSRNVYGDVFKSSAPLAVTDKIGPNLIKIEGADDVTYNRSTRTITLVFNEELNGKVVSLLSFEIPGVQIDEIVAHKNEIRIIITQDDRGKISEDTAIFQRLELRDTEGNVTTGIVTEVNKIK